MIDVNVTLDKIEAFKNTLEIGAKVKRCRIRKCI